MLLLRGPRISRLLGSGGGFLPAARCDADANGGLRVPSGCGLLLNGGGTSSSLVLARRCGGPFLALLAAKLCTSLANLPLAADLRITLSCGWMAVPELMFPA